MAAVITGRDALPVICLAAHDPDAVAPLVLLTGALRCLRPDIQARTPPCPATPLSISQHLLDRQKAPVVRQAAEPCPCADMIAQLSGGDEQIERASRAVADGVQLGGPLSGNGPLDSSFPLKPFGMADQAITPSFSIQRL